jgi:predicted CXXCH cytochrome family protein
MRVVATLLSFVLVACTGEAGPTGDPGQPGPSGDPGPAGPPAATTGTIAGVVKDGESGAPIAAVSITAQPGGAAATTAADGSFELTDVAVGSYTLAFAATGYDASTLTAVGVATGLTTNLDVQLFMPVTTSGGLAGVVKKRTFTNDPTAPLAGATVALVDAAALAASASDAPLETLAAASPYTATTAADGSYHIGGVAPARYYVHVTPAAAQEASLFPGGDASRASFAIAADQTVERNIELSQRAPANATYLGSSACLNCHTGSLASFDARGWKRSLHALVYRKPDAPSPTQDLSQLPNHDKGMAFFKDGNPRDNTGVSDGLGLRISNALFSKFPTTFNLLLGFDGKYFVQLESPTGVKSGKYYVELSFGGHGLYKERWITRAATDGSYAAGAAGPSSYYILPLQFDENLQPGVEPFHPYNPQNWGPPSVEGGPAQRPAQKLSFDANCAGCHFTGTKLTRDAEGNFRADAATSADGVIDYDGDGAKEEIDIGCEACHGPGSAHVFGGPARGKAILMPRLLSAERENMVCGACHTRGEGKGEIGGDHTEMPSKGSGTLSFPYPGMSRAEFVADYQDDHLGTYADDNQHARQHHQQYNDFLKSEHTKNPYQLLACSDCHGLHDRQNGPSLVASAQDNTLCLGCHAPYTFALPPSWSKEAEGEAVSAHMSDYASMNVGYDPKNLTGVAAATATGGVGQCVTCHMPKTASSQSRFMHESVVNGQPAGARIRGDVSSHQFDVVMPAVSEVLFTAGGSNNQMPNSCGSCHNRISGISPSYTW